MGPRFDYLTKRFNDLMNIFHAGNSSDGTYYKKGILSIGGLLVWLE
jgi:hypothetical protein